MKLEGKFSESKLRNAEVYLPKFDDVSISKNEDELEMVHFIPNLTLKAEKEFKFNWIVI